MSSRFFRNFSGGEGGRAVTGSDDVAINGRDEDSFGTAGLERGDSSHRRARPRSAPAGPSSGARTSSARQRPPRAVLGNFPSTGNATSCMHYLDSLRKGTRAPPRLRALPPSQWTAEPTPQLRAITSLPSTVHHPSSIIAVCTCTVPIASDHVDAELNIHHLGASQVGVYMQWAPVKDQRKEKQHRAERERDHAHHQPVAASPCRHLEAHIQLGGSA